ncbi:MAG TPA: TIGR03435 family protein [Bryobacteraceae bacterium]|jgi:uncharacterized protein (TIGR03435 family)|nr:TIGR03435 family protein [Bryobacteraceae bacterium]
MRYLLVLCFLVNAMPSAFSQTRLQFEVASIKPSDPDNSRTSFDPGAKVGRFVVTGASLKLLIGYAWDKQLTQISGGPKWLDSDPFDIEATKGNIDAPPPASLAQRPMYWQNRAMLQSLLEERFHLVVHNETRQDPVYEFVLARSGPRLKDATVDEAPRQQVSRGQITATATALSQLARLLAGLLDRQVVDKTGLAGRYNFTLTYAYDASRRGTVGPDADPAAAPDTPSLFTALQEQLGLSLKSARGPVEFLVIDRAEKPDAN